MAKMRHEGQLKREEEEKIEREKKDLDRIKRSMMLKKKIALSHQLPRTGSVPASAS